jgi:acyl-CoA dehydrogenase
MSYPAMIAHGSAPVVDDAAFVRALREFFAVALTADLREAGRNTTGVHSDIGACRVWHRRLYERGWIAPAWPVAFGGTNWSPAQRLIFERECAANDAPVLLAGGVRSLGPLLIAAGTPEQQRRYLPAILDGSDLWCQGFSETGAGSDLAALQTRAVVAEGRYVVSGSKIWTTGAHIANRMFCLVRTARGVKPQHGITFLLIDMASEGITVKPIRTLSGDFEFNEVLFDNVRVPFANRVGEENDGWSVAKHLMRLARGNNTTSGLLWRAHRKTEQTIDSHGGAACTELRQDLRALTCELAAFEALELRVLSRRPDDGVGSVEASMLKTLATELHQKLAAHWLNAAGTAVAASAATPSLWTEVGAFASRKYLATRAASIYSGTNETHRNLIAQRLLS